MAVADAVVAVASVAYAISVSVLVIVSVAVVLTLWDCLTPKSLLSAVNIHSVFTATYSNTSIHSYLTESLV